MTLADHARAYLKVPFRHQGRDPATGIDCIGLLVLACRDAGRLDKVEMDFTGYSRDPHDGLLEQHLERVFGPPVDDMRPGDIVALKYGGPIRHVGIVGDYLYGGLSLIHTDSRLGRVTEHRIDERWLDQIAVVHRLEASL